ncbi:SDR family oxidoreductase [Sphingopyxis sp. XHP0097]|uniref:SDR family oxidoreductase n=1 Tax=Sphingopyxis jiangsuensis TaxID=2871171 RepID=A0ABS7MHG5_9SPHN|nr:MULTISPECIES: SDR family oxidoreductase [Sphingopyxis]MBL0768667.1 SDR family oxidoreductase [Sphingopyxis lutea]MBY4638222.1 SDR family oxidoreductase [Sphingopyxis jiangsuensis]
MGRKAIFITGGGSGIGRAVARHFAAQGWFVGIADVNRTGIDETAALLPEGASSRHVMDVRDRDQWRAALDEFAAASGGRLDVLFNNAGIGSGGQFLDMPPEEADRLIAINFGGVVNGIYAAMPLLRATPGATILNTGSASGFYGVAGLAVYSATKFAVRGLTEGLEIEFAKYGVKVRSLMPGFIDTPLLDQVSADSNEPARTRLAEGGFEISPVERVAEAAWEAVHGNRVHVPVGKLAKRLARLSRWFPGLIAKQSKKIDGLGAVSTPH